MSQAGSDFLRIIHLIPTYTGGEGASILRKNALGGKQWMNNLLCGEEDPQYEGAPRGVGRSCAGFTVSGSMRAPSTHSTCASWAHTPCLTARGKRSPSCERKQRRGGWSTQILTEISNWKNMSNAISAVFKTSKSHCICAILCLQYKLCLWTSDRPWPGCKSPSFLSNAGEHWFHLLCWQKLIIQTMLLRVRFV